MRGRRRPHGRILGYQRVIIQSQSLLPAKRNPFHAERSPVHALRGDDHAERSLVYAVRDADQAMKRENYPKRGDSHAILPPFHSKRNLNSSQRSSFYGFIQGGLALLFVVCVGVLCCLSCRQLFVCCFLNWLSQHGGNGLFIAGYAVAAVDLLRIQYQLKLIMHTLLFFSPFMNIVLVLAVYLIRTDCIMVLFGLCRLCYPTCQLMLGGGSLPNELSYMLARAGRKQSILQVIYGGENEQPIIAM